MFAPLSREELATWEAAKTVRASRLLLESYRHQQLGSLRSCLARLQSPGKLREPHQGSHRLRFGLDGEQKLLGKRRPLSTGHADLQPLQLAQGNRTEPSGQA